MQICKTCSHACQPSHLASSDRELGVIFRQAYCQFPSFYGPLTWKMTPK